MDEIEDLKNQLAISEANRRGAEQANEINYNLRRDAERKMEEVYRILTPEKAPWGPVSLGNGVTCSPYLLSEVPGMIRKLMQENSESTEKLRTHSCGASDLCAAGERPASDHSERTPR